MANVQVPDDLLTDMYRLVVLLDGRLDGEPYLDGLRGCIEGQIEGKLEAIKRRELFTAYKTAPKSTSDREAARQKYLDRAGILADFRSNLEV